MTRGKPLIFSRKPGSKNRARKKAEAESAFIGAILPISPPPELKNCPTGRRAWRGLLRAFSKIPADLLSGLDKNFLVSYCLAVEARQKAFELERKVNELYDEGVALLPDLLKARVELRQSTRLVTDLEKQLYATPKSRGGVSPAQRQLTPDEVVARELAALDDMLGDET